MKLHRKMIVGLWIVSGILINSGVSLAADETYLCKFAVINDRVDLRAEFEFDENTAVQTTMDVYSFAITQKTQTFGEAIVVGIGHPGGASGAIAPMGTSHVVAVHKPAASPSDVVQAVCELQ
jgi:hypothetical protein